MTTSARFYKYIPLNVVGRLVTESQSPPAFLVVFAKPLAALQDNAPTNYLRRAFGERRAVFFVFAVLLAFVDRLVVVFLAVVFRTAMSMAPGGRE